MFDLFWLPISYDEAITEVAKAINNGELDQKGITFVLRRISQQFKVENGMRLSSTIFERMVRLEERVL
jgi:hypothetical protein